jgi:uncharacterized membrane protein
MVVPGRLALPLTAATPGPLVTLVVAVVLFAVVVVVTVVVLSLLQAVLPATDTEAEAVHRRELEAERQARAEVAAEAEEPDRAAGEPGGAGGVVNES